MAEMNNPYSGISEQSEQQKTPEIQTFFNGLNTANQPYLLSKHAPYLLNMKFDSSGETLYRRDGHKIFRSFQGEKILSAVQALDETIFYITKNGSTITLRNLRREQSKPIEKSVDISSYVTISDGDIIDNMDVVTGFVSGSYNAFPYFNIKDSDGNIKSSVNLKTNIDLSSIGSNDIIKVTHPPLSSPLNMISHSYFNKNLFLLIKDGDNFRLAWSTKEENLELEKSSIIPNNEKVYAIKSFGDAVFIYAEDRVYRVVFNNDKTNINIEVHSEGYGTTSNKLIRGVGTSIYYYGESSGLSSMAGAKGDIISDVSQLQMPVDNYASNFHKVFRARSICYKKDDNSLYIIGNIDCDYIAKAIHWQTVYCQSSELMTEDEYIKSYNKFKDTLRNSDQFILEYNVTLTRFSLHYYDKKVLGHFNMRLKLKDLEYDQSSELIFTEDYIATTHSDFTDDAGTEFPVQINTIPRNKGLFSGFISSINKAHIKFTSNSVPVPDRKIYVTNLDMVFSIVNKNLSLNIEDTTEHISSNRITNILTISNTISSILPSYLIGFYSHNILIFDGVNIENNVSGMNNI